MNLEITKFVKWEFWFEVWGCYRLIAEDSGLLGCYAMSAGKHLQMFQKYKGPFTSLSMDCMTVKMEILQSLKNIGNYLTVDMACCTRSFNLRTFWPCWRQYWTAMQSNILLLSPAYILAVDNTVFTRMQKTLRCLRKNTRMPRENIFMQI